MWEVNTGREEGGYSFQLELMCWEKEGTQGWELVVTGGHVLACCEVCGWSYITKHLVKRMALILRF